MNDIFRYIAKLIKELQGNPLFLSLLFASQCANIYKFMRKVFITIKKGIAEFRNDLTRTISKMARMASLKFELFNSNLMNKQLQYAHLGITKRELLDRISNSESSAFRFNALIDGAIIGIPVGKVDDKTIFHQFVRENNDFRDLGLCN